MRIVLEEGVKKTDAAERQKKSTEQMFCALFPGSGEQDPPSDQDGSSKHLGNCLATNGIRDEPSGGKVRSRNHCFVVDDTTPKFPDK
ncbi:hypothetical protein JXA56_05885 [Candidatus Micrarchaeota archaeon]|nr:hypothetical protein [Candidatus Micrarchaeota archaeon]